MNSLLMVLFTTIAAQYQIPTAVLVGVCAVESGLDLNAIAYHDGGLNRHSFGVCQVQYTTAREMGFHRDRHCETKKLNKCSLLEPAVNIQYAAQYLSYQLTRYKGDLNKALSAYNAGSYSKKNTKYVKKVRAKEQEAILVWDVK